MAAAERGAARPTGDNRTSRRRRRHREHCLRTSGYAPGPLPGQSLRARAHVGPGRREVSAGKESGGQLFFPGHESRATEALCWAEGQRLFSAGLNGEIIEYDLQALNIKYAMDAFGGPIWSMAASPSGSQLLVGCEDGSVKLFQITPDKIQFERNFDRQKSRILSLSWRPSGTHIAAGSIDYISVFDVKSGSTVHKMIVDRQYMGVSKRKCIVWGVAFLSDGTVISVDSAGKVQFWDSATGTLVKSHLIANADVQSIAVANGPENIICSCISPCGSWIAYSTASRFFLYRLNYEHDNLSLKRVSKMPAFLRSALQILFSEDSTKLFVASNQGALHIFQLSGGSFKHLHAFQPQSGTVEAMCLLAVSADGNWLAASGTSAGVHVYNVKQLKLHCTVPAYNFPVTAMAVAPNTNNLVIAYSDQQVFEYSIPDKHYTDWSRTVQKHGFHHLWLQRDTPITHISFHPKRPMHILLHDAYMFCIIDKSLPLPNDKTLFYNPFPPTNESDVVQRRTAHAFKISKIYKPLLFMDLLDERTLVAVERPLDDIIAQLPPPIKKKKFGT
ncbi:U3 small nucleolar RNA-associated protein 4 homolog isoform X8 [Callithrix jacchus]|uniref:U3 small nucleolar RNA-associated protein 4 homolog isoform X7 n=1 Tax=Callithrix jacchus TaxID=9483 RepID=UPI00159D5A5E|nr:U3 small nucleolar RNA-associated protein 4 homolog isoform X7 [Callithrix jacchus]